MTSLKVENCGPATTVQDFGRFGYRRYGVPTSGAMDHLAMAAANALVGNPPGQAAIEFMLQGGALRVQGSPVLVAAAGPGCRLAINGRSNSAQTSAIVASGDVVTVGPVTAGAFAYLAVAGGIDRPAEMGSRSVHRRSGIGGRPLAAGDTLECGNPHGPAIPRRFDRPPEAAAYGPFRLLPGPQEGFFRDTALELLLNCEFRVETRSDRMAFRLAGPALPHRESFNLISDGTVAGSIQVPGDRQPIVLMRDCQTTGGYPKIATVISADLDRLAQTQPGSPLRFRQVSFEEAVTAARERHRTIGALAGDAAPVGEYPATEDLLSLNLVGGAVDANRFPDRD